MKKAIGILGALALMLSAFAVQPLAISAQIAPANEAAEFCRQLDAVGLLANAGWTRGECVNLIKSPALSPSYIAALCGGEVYQEGLTGTTNKGQCIQAINELIAAN